MKFLVIVLCILLLGCATTKDAPALNSRSTPTPTIDSTATATVESTIPVTANLNVTATMVPVGAGIGEISELSGLVFIKIEDGSIDRYGVRE